MIDRERRSAILTLKASGHGIKRIARLLKVSRNTVKKVLTQGPMEVPPVDRPEILLPYIDRIKELHKDCKGNIVRVHEELAEDWKRDGVDIQAGYS